MHSYFFNKYFPVCRRVIANDLERLRTAQTKIKKIYIQLSRNAKYCSNRLGGPSDTCYRPENNAFCLSPSAFS